MKSQWVGLVMLVSAVMSPAWAQAGTLIQCKFKNSPLFGIMIQTAKNVPVHGYIAQKYPAEVTFAGPRLWNATQETLEVDYINTRVDVDVSYYVKLDKNAEISLKTIWWPQQKLIGGTYTANGKAQELVCGAVAQCKVPPQADCSRGLKRICCDCDVSGKLSCN